MGQGVWLVSVRVLLVVWVFALCASASTLVVVLHCKFPRSVGFIIPACALLVSLLAQLPLRPLTQLCSVFAGFRDPSSVNLSMLTCMLSNPIFLQDSHLYEVHVLQHALCHIAHECLEASRLAQLAAEKAAALADSRALLISRVSHEIRTPLNAVLGCLQELPVHAQLDPQHTQMMHNAISCASTITDLLDGLNSVCEGNQG
eukprot:NODE_2049_length_779_cov_68.331507_g1638_i0.p1 GENE.NODE_2049_length_779_cov_68.331507_g1638_i0~~NODE_2049_length_779_cov_68.331507_g1638_i0.p1  ORF type:complete len:225 (-),score=70.73 NODE_2049_length_779_cov_68.331507_g1638_i0:105-710(-)